jgi:3-dehydroquinate synthase
MDLVFVYGPPGSGKSTVAKVLAGELHLPFLDLDAEIESASGRSVREIFAEEGEAAFRALERNALQPVVSVSSGVIALGGGTLLDPANRETVEDAGPVVVLGASPGTLLSRLGDGASARPLLADDPRRRLEELLSRRAEHYRSFAHRVDTEDLSAGEVVSEIHVLAGAFRLEGSGDDCDIRTGAGLLERLGTALRRRGLGDPVAVISDSNVGPLHGPRVVQSLSEAGYEVHRFDLAAGEEHKTVASVSRLWEFLLEAGLERDSTVVALGGGVVGDLAGFAAATFLRGVPWIAVPTSLLAMVDASIGGKTGANLPQGKNLVGAFRSPRLVLADPDVLQTLPEAEMTNGLAEVVKHGVIGDPSLFDRCAAGVGGATSDRCSLVRRAMAVKVGVVSEDPGEKGRRAVLNLGHTVGHALEQVSGYRVRHGEAVAIGMVAEARLAERLGVAREQGLAERIAGVLSEAGLPIALPTGTDPPAVLEATAVDKKRVGGKVPFALPIRVGEVRPGIEAPLDLVLSVLREMA